MEDKYSKNTYSINNKMLLNSFQIKTAKRVIYRMDNPSKKYFDKPWYKTIAA